MDQSVDPVAVDLPFLLELEQPSAGGPLYTGTSLQGFGWALARDRIRGITVSLGDTPLARATIRLLRPDVAEVHRRYPDHAHAGFAFAATVPSGLVGSCQLRFAVDTDGGAFVKTFPVRITPPPVLGSDQQPAREAPSIALAEARLNEDGTLEIGGDIFGSWRGETVEIRLGDRVIGFAKPEATELSSADDETAASPIPVAKFRFRTLIDPTRACDPVNVIMPDAEHDIRASRPVLLPPAGAVAGDDLPVMVTRIDTAFINEQGILSVSGWTVCLATITDVTIYLDDTRLGVAQMAISRLDVGADYPDYPSSSASGFRIQRTLSDEQLDAHVVRVITRAVGGIHREVTIPVTRPDRIRRAASAQRVDYFIDAASLTASGVMALKGWAVCPSGVEIITIEVAGQTVGTAELGDDRPDVGNMFPNIASAAESGFRFATSAAPPCEGEQIIRLTVRGHDGEERVILQPVLVSPGDRTVAVEAAAASSADQIKFFLDIPAVENGHAVAPVRGFMSLNGWAFARSGAVRIEVFVDGVSQGEAYRGIRRDDLQDAFPDWDALLAGFAMLIPPQVMKVGRHQVQLLVRDTHGNTAELSFTVDAEAASEGPGPWQLRRKIPQAETDQQLALLAAAEVRPSWSLLMQMGRITEREIANARATIASLRDQAYPDWRLAIALPIDTDVAAAAAELLAGLDDLAGQVDIHVYPSDRMIAELAAAADFVSLLSPGDLLGEDALLALSVEVASRPRSDFFYSDERRIDPADGEMKAFFKPDWSPDLLLSTNYIGRLWAARRSLLDAAGISLGDLERTGEYDAVLRLCERATRIAHVGKVLCMRGAVQIDPAAKQRAALQRAARRHDIKARVLPGCVAGTWRFKRDVIVEGRLGALVSIIIPSIASRGLIETTIRSVREKTAWHPYEIIILDNIRSTEGPEKLRWKRWMTENADRVIEIDEAFNWSRFNNIGAAQARGDFFLFLNDDVEVLDKNWLHDLVEHAQRPEVGAVGPQLLYPDGRVQHAGIFLSQSVGRHAFRFYPKDAPGPFGLALTQRNVISVTGACYMVRRDVFEELGGFDEAHPVVNNDLDFSLRLHDTGRLVVYTPHVTLTHHEMVSRASLKDVYDSAIFNAAWRDLFLQGDPYFHPTLSSDYDDYLPEAEPLRQFQVGHPLIAKDRVRRILAVKVDHIGDFIAAFPAFRRLKAHFPNAELTVLGARASASLTALEPAIDRFIEFNFFNARSELGRLKEADIELRALRQTLEPLRFDIAVDLRRQSDTRPILQQSGARWLAGFDQDHAMPWLDISVEFEGDVERTFKRSHVTDSLLHLIDAIGTACETDRAVVSAPPSLIEAHAFVRTVPAIAAVATQLYARPVVCVHTGAGAANKQWPAVSFADLIDLLVGHEGVNVMLIGGPDEAAFAAEVLSRVRRQGQVFSLIGAVSLRDLPQLLLTAALYVGNDSGPKHMAAAVGVPTIGIHSGSVDAGEWGPMGTATLTIRRDMTCGPCYIAVASDCPRAMACLHGIKVGEVYQACRRLLLLRKNVMMEMMSNQQTPAEVTAS